MSITESSVPYVRLGKSGLKVSKIILGCMSYGHPDWSGWILGEEEGIKQIKDAYDLGINTFDTANVYSAGLSEVILGKAIKQHNLPRDEIVVMTKVFGTEEREMVPLLQDMGVGMIPWSPLARGFLCRSVKEESYRAKTDWYMFVNGDPERDTWLVDINERVADIAQKRGISMAQVALAWSLSKPYVTAPIVGTTSTEKLKDLIGCERLTYRGTFIAGVHIKLTEEEVKSIDELYKPRAITGH
ncbi:hypothetical protein FRC00_000321 [Tulasnella sp. 408]|nr:hypothetical protein FRC00_000321 [Tulasnella sp. 408]